MNNLHQCAEEIYTLLQLKTFPLAVKLLKKESNIPPAAKRPKRDFGYHLSLCQGLSISRREKTEMAMLKEDMWCFEPVIGLGLAEAPQEFLEGHNRFPETAITLEAGSKWARGMPRLEMGKYVGVVFAPLVTADFEPDLVIIYCDPNQMTHLLRAVNCIDGDDITSQLSGHAACVYAIAPVIKKRRFEIILPCRGDRGRAMAQDDELIFAAPKEKLVNLLAGLKYLADRGHGLPERVTIKPEYPLSESYKKLARMLGMDI